MSYRTYILEKELAEVKAERDALLFKIAQLDHRYDEYAGGHWAIQEDVRDYPDEKTGED